MPEARPSKTKIFLLLALEQKARRNPVLPEKENSEDEVNAPDESFSDADFPAFFEQFGADEAAQFRQLLSDFQNKTETERADWSARLKASIGRDEPFLDENIHHSHIENALLTETPAIRKIISDAVNDGAAKNVSPPNGKRFLLEKQVRRVFASKFVSLNEIENATAFDRLSGSQLARLVRLAGVREVSTACLRIEAVEAVAAFIRNFPAEDARMIAAHLASVPEISEDRIAFAEKLVHAAFEIEPNPSAMLDWLGVRLTGILLCRNDDRRVRYTQQKLPHEFSSRLPIIIDENCRRTPPAMQREIAAEIERLAVTVTETV